MLTGIKEFTIDTIQEIGFSTQSYFEKYIQYKIIINSIYIFIEIILIIFSIWGLIFFFKKAYEEQEEIYILVLIPFIAFLTCSIVLIPINIFELLKWIFIPEIYFIKDIKK